MRIIVTGLIAQYPLGGLTWHYLQYVVGLKQLGHDVFYFEDTNQYPYNPIHQEVSKTCEYNVNYLMNLMERYDLEDCWAYRFPWHSEWFGLIQSRRNEILSTADLLINVSGTHGHLDEYSGVGRMCYVDTDPVFTQLKLARGQKDFQKLVERHERLFSFGQTLPGNLPDTGHHWIPTRQPVLLSEWKHAGCHRDVFTTLMNWTSYNSVEFDGVTYGQKDLDPDSHFSFDSANHRVASDAFIYAGWKALKALRRSTPNG